MRGDSGISDKPTSRNPWLSLEAEQGEDKFCTWVGCFCGGGELLGSYSCSAVLLEGRESSHNWKGLQRIFSPFFSFTNEPVARGLVCKSVAPSVDAKVPCTAPGAAVLFPYSHILSDILF